MNIIGQKTILKKSVINNPTNAIFDSIVRPATSIGFTFDKQPEKGIMVFAVHVSLKIEYSATSNYIFEGYDGTVFNSFTERPIANLLLTVITNAIKRLNELFTNDIKVKPIYLSQELSFDFSDDDILKILLSDINEAYPNYK